MSEDAVRVVRGRPTDEELAALVVALSAVSSARQAEAPSAVVKSSWTDRARLMTTMWTAGPRGWRASSSRR